MKLSLNWVKQYTEVNLSRDELVSKIGTQLGEVEDVVNYGERYKGVTIAKVVSCTKHPDADKLSVCLIDDNNTVNGVDRDKDGLIQVVCGAPNVRPGLLVTWVPPGTIIPNTFTNKDYPIVIESKNLRGVISHGMLASSKELSIGDNHSGIVEIDKDAVPGEAFSHVYGLDDLIIDIENKMFTHRPDLFGELGLAREVAGISGKKFNSPDWYRADTATQTVAETNLPLTVKNEIPELVPRFCVQMIKDVRIKPSPLELQTYLSRLDIRPINNVVDLTNYYMLLTAQPLHAYDYDKLKAFGGTGSGPAIIVRKPHEGESLQLLNSKTVKPSGDAIIIANQSQAIGLGGIMGGADTEVDENTKNIILECANFDMYSIRRTAMDLGLFTEATTRFNKGQSPRQNRIILDKVVADLTSATGGSIAGPVYDDFAPLGDLDQLKITPGFVNERLGLNLTIEEMAELLGNVEFTVNLADNQLNVSVPFWRTDIKINEDVVEEIGRLYGFNKLNLDLPVKDIMPPKRNTMFDLKSTIRDLLVRADVNEVLTYSFISRQLIEMARQDPSLAYELSNPSSPQQQFYRLSLLPSLLSKVHPNIKAGFSEFALFEMNRCHVKGIMQVDEPALPDEAERLGFVIAVDDKLAQIDYSGAPYYQVAYYLRYLMAALGIAYELKPYQNSPDNGFMNQMLKIFEPNRTSLVYAGDILLGAIGEPLGTVKHGLKLPKFCAIGEFDLKGILKLVKMPLFSKLSHYPKISLDICLRVPESVSYGALIGNLSAVLKKQPYDMSFDVNPVDIFQKPDDSEHKQITFRLTMHSQARTLTITEGNEIISQIGEAAKTALNAEVV